VTTLAAEPALDREALRSRVFLRSVLPLLEDLPGTDALFRGVSARVAIEVRGTDVGATLVLRDGALAVEQGVQPAEVRWIFPTLRALNAFFAGKVVLPRIKGLRHPVLIWKTVRLLMRLRILHPQPSPAQPALRVKLLLRLVTRALAELHRGGHPEMVFLVADSPERVYQWTVGGADVAHDIGAYLRMERGRVKAGRGTYTRRRPFVHFAFADVDAALAVLTATGSQMTGVRSGQLKTLGSPEYTRKIALLMQKIDQLLQEG
jgi:hypothetical protein